MNWTQVGIGYTIATGNLYTDFNEFHKAIEEILERPVLTHELAEHAFWHDLRKAFEAKAKLEVHK